MISFKGSDTLEEMRSLLIEQIRKINNKGDSITPQELDNAYKAIDIIKDIDTICAMKEATEDYGRGEESYHYPYMMGDRSWDDISYARGRSPMTGRYVSRDNRSYERGYSSEDEKEQMYRALDAMRVKIDKMK